MAMEVKLRLCLLILCTLFLPSMSLSHGEEVVEDSTISVSFDQCVSQCQRSQGDISEYLACERSCELRQREGQGGGGDEWDRERGRWSPRDPQERERREREHREQDRREVERERQWDERRREDERERAREWERDEDFDDDNQRDPERERERQRREQERRERERERREYGGENEEDSENRRDPEKREERQRKEQHHREEEHRERERREHGGRNEHDSESRKEPEKEREERQRKEQHRREEERRERERTERESREHRGRREGDSETRKDPEQEQQQEKHRREQERREEQRREQERRERECREREHGGRNPRTERWDEDERSQRNNPYHFPRHRLQSVHRSQEGQYRILERFHERTDLLRGIKNNRFTVLEARPNTFIIPNHVDAESVHFVVRGRATISLVWQEKRDVRKESYNIEQGNVIRIPAGVTVYLINRDDNENLEIASLVQPVNNPDEFRAYFPAGNENPQSYYNVFSNDILEAALNTPRDELHRLFRQHGQRQGGAITIASKEQLRSLSQSASSAGLRGRHSRSGPISLQKQRPTFSNKFGQFFEASPEEFQQLRDMDVFINLAEINQGAMMVPHFNSRATVLVYVAEGSGRFEMGCPHVANQGRERHRRGSTAREDESFGSESEEDQEYSYGQSEKGQEGRGRSRIGSGQIHRVSAHLSQGDVFVIPAGHPIAIVANENENLRLVGFGINGGNNKRNFLAGQENIMNQLDREAKELAFNIRGREAEEIFRRQEQSFFTEGPSGRLQSRPRRTSSSSSEEYSGRRDPLSSILNLTGIL